MPTYHANIAVENKKQTRMSFLNIHITRKDKTFTTSFYRKPIFSRVYTYFDSFLPFTSKSL